MATKKQTTAPVAPPTSHTTIQNCNFDVHCDVNEHTRDAVIALAAASQANAEAIAQIAKALQATVPSYGIYLANGK